MNLEVKKIGKHTYLYKRTSVALGNGKYKNIREQIGKLEDLQKDFDDPIQHFKDLIKEEDERIKNELKENSKITIDTGVINTSLYENNDITEEKFNLNAGCIYLLNLFHMLGLQDFFDRIKRVENIKFNLSKAVQLMIVCRALFPESKYSDFCRRFNFAEVFDLKKDDLYKSLTLLDTYQDELFKWIHLNIKNIYSYNLKETHYDITNFFMYTQNTNFYIDFGYSKVKNNYPTVQFAMLTDSNGVPMNMKLFNGKTSDVSTLVKFLRSQNEIFKLKNTTIIADAGLNSFDNLAAIILSGNSYIIKQSLLKTNRNIMDTFESIVKPAVEKIMEENPSFKGCYFDVNLEIPIKFSSDLADLAGHSNIKNSSKKATTTIVQKFVFTYSKKFDERFKKIRMEELVDASKYIKNPNKIREKFKTVAAGLVKIDAGNVEASVNQKLLDKYENISGYSLLVTNRLKASAQEIVNSYKNQYRIEHSFRSSKSGLDSDNIFVRRPDRINGHFIISYLALKILKIIENSIDFKMSFETIQQTLKEFTFEKLRNSSYYQLSEYSSRIDAIQRKYGIKINKYHYSKQEIRELIASIKKNKNEIIKVEFRKKEPTNYSVQTSEN